MPVKIPKNSVFLTINYPPAPPNDQDFKNWAKCVTEVDFGKRGAESYDGIYIASGEAVFVPVGAPVITCIRKEGVNSGYPLAKCYVVSREGKLLETDGKSYRWSQEELAFKTHVARVLTEYEKSVGTEKKDGSTQILDRIVSTMREHGLTFSDLARHHFSDKRSPDAVVAGDDVEVSTE